MLNGASRASTPASPGEPLAKASPGVAAPLPAAKSAVDDGGGAAMWSATRPSPADRPQPADSYGGAMPGDSTKSVASTSTPSGSPAGALFQGCGAGGRGLCTPPRQRSLSGQRFTPALQRGAVSPVPLSSRDPMAAVRREVDHAEARLRGELARLVRDAVAAAAPAPEQWAREAALNFKHLEQKCLDQENVQFGLQRRISEMNGVLRGLSEETQLQIRKADAVENRIWDLRHQLEEAFDKRCADIERQTESVQASSSRCSTELALLEEAQRSMQQGLQRMEARVARQSASKEDVEGIRQTSAALQEELESMREQLQGLSQGAVDAACDAAQQLLEQSRQEDAMDSAQIWQLEQKVADAVQRLDQLQEQAHSDNGWGARLHEHEVKLGSLRAKLLSLEEHQQGFEGRVRSDWESRFQYLQRVLQEIAHRGCDDRARLEALEEGAPKLDGELSIVSPDLLQAADRQSDGGGGGSFGSFDGIAPAQVHREPNFGSVRDGAGGRGCGAPGWRSAFGAEERPALGEDDGNRDDVGDSCASSRREELISSFKEKIERLQERAWDSLQDRSPRHGDAP